MGFAVVVVVGFVVVVDVVSVVVVALRVVVLSVVVVVVVVVDEAGCCSLFFLSLMIFTTCSSIFIFCLRSASNRGAKPIRPFDFARIVSGLLIVMMFEFVSLGSFLNCFPETITFNGNNMCEENQVGFVFRLIEVCCWKKLCFSQSKGNNAVVGCKKDF